MAPSWICATIDCRNAYNSVSRRQMAQQLYGLSYMRPLFRLFGLLYATPSALHFQDGSGADGGHATTLYSQSGCRQGCTFSSVLFCLALHPVLIAAAKAHPNVRVRAYMDDITLVGPSSDVVACILLLRRLLHDIDLDLNEKKSFLWSPASDVSDAMSRTGFKASDGGIKVLGAWVGEDAATLNYLSAAVNSHDMLFTSLPALPADVAFPLLRACAIPRWNFLVRTHDPALSLDSTLCFDAMSLNAFLSIARISAGKQQSSRVPVPDLLSTTQKMFLHLPTALGGLGVTSYEVVAPGAYLSSMDPDNNCQAVATAIANADIVVQLDADPEAASHRAARCKKHTTTALCKPGCDPVSVSHALQHAIDYCPPTAATKVVCMNKGCKYICTPPEASHHTIGCALGIGEGPTATHSLVACALESLMREGNIPFSHEKELNDPADPDAALRIETFAHFAKFDAYIDVTVASSECKTHYGKQWSKL